jgi:hypothetical protein
MLLPKSIEPKRAWLPTIAWPARTTCQYRPGVKHRCAPGRKPPGRTSRPESRATGRTSPLSCCSGKYPNPLARLLHECEHGTQSRDARHRELPEPRSRGRCVAPLYNQERPHSALGYETPAAFAAELHKQWPVPLRPTGSAPQAIVSPAPMRDNNRPALIPAG